MYCEINKYGWVCPKCGKVNAPWISSCDCNTQYQWTWTEPYPPTVWTDSDNTDNFEVTYFGCESTPIKGEF
jgi:hypothetical protein